MVYSLLLVICSRPLRFEGGSSAQAQLPLIFTFYAYKEDRADLLRRKRENIKKHREAVSDACGKMGGSSAPPSVR